MVLAGYNINVKNKYIVNELYNQHIGTVYLDNSVPQLG